MKKNPIIEYFLCYEGNPLGTLINLFFFLVQQLCVYLRTLNLTFTNIYFLLKLIYIYIYSKTQASDHKRRSIRILDGVSNLHKHIAERRS